MHCRAQLRELRGSSREQNPSEKRVSRGAQAMFRTWYPRTVARSQSLVYSQKEALVGTGLPIFQRFKPAWEKEPAGYDAFA